MYFLDKEKHLKFLDSLKRFGELAIKYDIAQGLTVGEAANSREYKMKEQLVFMQILFDNIEKDIDLESIDVDFSEILELLDLPPQTPFPKEKTKEQIQIRKYLKSRIKRLAYGQKLLKNNKSKKKITAKVFTKLILDLNIIDEEPYPEMRKKICNLIALKDHKIFGIVEIIREVKRETILDYIKTIKSDTEYFPQNYKLKYKTLFQEVKSFLSL